VDTTRPTLLLRIRDRADTDAWRTFDAIYRPMLLAFARARGLHEADAADVVQHCLSAIADHIQKFDYDPNRGQFKAWLRTLVNNRVRNFRRGQAVASAESADFDIAQDREAAPDEVFERLWLEEHLRHCLHALRGETDERTFRAFERYVIDEQSAESVAAELGLSVNNVYTIKWRLTQKVAERMRELTGESS